MTAIKLRLFVLIAAGFVAFVWWTLAGEHAAVDACLDGGGRWDYDTETCAGG